MIELTEQQQAELATGRVLVAVPCEPQPPEGFVKWGEPCMCYYKFECLVQWFIKTLPDEDFRAFSLASEYKPHDKIPTPAGDAIVRDVDVRLAERWEWVVTLELTTMSEYRILRKGEIIQEGDEVDGCRDPWRDDPVWVPAKCIGKPAPDPAFTAHRIYRRRVNQDAAIAKATGEET